MNERVLGVVGTLFLLLSAAVAQAQELAPSPAPPAAGPGPGGFGGMGQVTIGSDFGISFLHNVDAETSSLSLSPALDYFFAPALSLGGQLQLDYNKAGGASTTVLGLGPRVGYVIPLGDMFSVYPKAGLYLQHVSFSPGGGGSSSSYNLFSLFLSAPFLFHPVPHFFVGIGPTLFANLAGANSARRDLQIGLVSTVGGWFDW
jgi:hypothetical protein